MRLELRAGLRLGYWGCALAQVSFGMGLGSSAWHWGGAMGWSAIRLLKLLGTGAGLCFGWALGAGAGHITLASIGMWHGGALKTGGLALRACSGVEG